MRGKIVFVVIAAMLLVLVWLVGTRSRDAHVMPAPRGEEAAAPSASQPVATPEAPAEAGSVAVVEKDAAPVATDAHATALDRAVRVVAPSWELAAALLVANGGRMTADGSAVRSGGIEATVDVVAAERDVEARLARGGADADGADVGVVPLPDFVASYERLRALEPQVFHVAGWSHGREVLLGARDGMLAKPITPAGDVAVVAADTSSEVLALFALDAAGQPPTKVRLGGDPQSAAYAGVVRPLSGDRPAGAPSKVLLSTGEASQLIPFVAVAPRGFIEAHRDALVSLMRAWSRGSTGLFEDVPSAARRIATEPGAPDPAALLERLGWTSPVLPGDVATAMGLSPGPTPGIGALFALDWRLLRDAGVLTSPAPSTAPVATEPFAAAFPETLGGEGARGNTQRPAAPDARVLLARRADKPDAQSTNDDVTWLSDVFPPCPVRVATRAGTTVIEVLSPP
ncbi:MAG TPA: hypothetical protein VF765_18145 [Polyangiaceae bacterium]